MSVLQIQYRLVCDICERAFIVVNAAQDAVEYGWTTVFPDPTVDPVDRCPRCTRKASES